MLTQVPLFLSFVLFGIGVIGFLLRRNIIILLMFIELMLNAANLAFVSLSKTIGDMSGQVYVMFIFAIAAAEAGVGLAIAILIYRQLKTTDVDKINNLRG
ncbi:MAG TPA: NADH-quinone oxidoreductase subunit NuoK [bacterium]